MSAKFQGPFWSFFKESRNDFRSSTVQHETSTQRTHPMCSLWPLDSHLLSESGRLQSWTWGSKDRPGHPFFSVLSCQIHCTDRGAGKWCGCGVDLCQSVVPWYQKCVGCRNGIPLHRVYVYVSSLTAWIHAIAGKSCRGNSGALQAKWKDSSLEQWNLIIHRVENYDRPLSCTSKELSWKLKKYIYSTIPKPSEVDNLFDNKYNILGTKTHRKHQKAIISNISCHIFTWCHTAAPPFSLLQGMDTHHTCLMMHCQENMPNVILRSLVLPGASSFVRSQSGVLSQLVGQMGCSWTLEISWNLDTSVVP